MPASFNGTLSQIRVCSHWKLSKSCACKVCLKQWDLDYDSVLQLLNFPHLSVRHKYLNYNVLVVTCTFHVVSNKVIYHINLFAQAHLTLLDLLHILITCIIRLYLLYSIILEQFTRLCKLKCFHVFLVLKGHYCIILRHLDHISY